MPAAEHLIASFVAFHAGKVRHDTIGNWLAGLAAWHALNGAAWCGERLLAYVKRGAKKLEPPPKEKRPPVTLEHMHALFKFLDLKNSFDAAVFAIACVAFWGCRRLGELVIPSRGCFDAVKHATADTEVRVRTLPSGAKYTAFHVPWTKTTKNAGADVILTGNPDPSDPITALSHHRILNASIPPGAPMFSFLTNDTEDGWAPMTRDWFLERCNEIWPQNSFSEERILTSWRLKVVGSREPF
ncbi:hypothetical protein BN946_scf185042.g182 [Trametes cinnabarina]|uniref:Tyr recombinase domain-containing protein n=1 Tax=Pycnoporus cinnabarinus TaxID=5643 RepID=A0A060S4N3_PYCCI|nr:hypothetical protein BN946_scf185042.g182 [Trametes cinnabarina]